MRGLAHVLKATAGSPLAGAILGAVGFVTAVISALSNAVAAAIATAALLAVVAVLLIRAQRLEAAFDGPYKILECDVTWDLGKDDASEALATRRHKVRFYVRTSVVSIRATNTSGNDPFAEFKADYGVKIGPTKTRGNEWRHAVIWLHKEAEPAYKPVTLTHEYTERDAFPDLHDEWIRLDGTQHGPSSLTVRFPRARPPLNVRLRRTHNGHDQETDVAAEDLRDEGDRKVYRLSKPKMKPGEEYRLIWDWEPRLS
jgi:hypothetical protein